MLFIAFLSKIIVQIFVQADKNWFALGCDSDWNLTCLLSCNILYSLRIVHLLSGKLSKETEMLALDEGKALILAFRRLQTSEQWHNCLIRLRGQRWVSAMRAPKVSASEWQWAALKLALIWKCDRLWPNSTSTELEWPTEARARHWPIYYCRYCDPQTSGLFQWVQICECVCVLNWFLEQISKSTLPTIDTIRYHCLPRHMQTSLALQQTAQFYQIIIFANILLLLWNDFFNKYI